MTPSRLLRRAAWAAAGLIALAGVRTWSVTAPTGPTPTRPLTALAPERAFVASPTLARSAALIRRHNPFRLDRAPSMVRYDPWAPAGPATIPAPRPARPALTVVGILGGPPWNVLVEGIPGREGGVLLAVGEEANGIRLVQVRGDTVHLTGFDTTWGLTPRRPWR